MPNLVQDLTKVRATESQLCYLPSPVTGRIAARQRTTTGPGRSANLPGPVVWVQGEPQTRPKPETPLKMWRFCVRSPGLPESNIWPGPA